MSWAQSPRPADAGAGDTVEITPKPEKNALPEPALGEGRRDARKTENPNRQRQTKGSLLAHPP